MLFWRKWRTAFKIAFFGALACGLFLGMRASPTPAMYSWVSTAYHISGLFVLTLLSFLAFPRWPLWVHGVLIFGAGILIEYTQSFQPRRVADPADIYANASGVLAAIVLISFFKWWRKRTKKSREKRLRR
jgi:VanZ family protein